MIMWPLPPPSLPCGCCPPVPGDAARGQLVARRLQDPRGLDRPPRRRAGRLAALRAAARPRRRHARRGRARDLALRRPELDDRERQAEGARQGRRAARRAEARARRRAARRRRPHARRLQDPRELDARPAPALGGRRWRRHAGRRRPAARADRDAPGASVVRRHRGARRVRACVRRPDLQCGRSLLPVVASGVQPARRPDCCFRHATAARRSAQARARARRDRTAPRSGTARARSRTRGARPPR